MTNILLNKKIATLKHIEMASSASSPMVSDEKPSHKPGQWRFGRKAKYALAIVVAAILLISFSAAVYSSNSECSRWLGIDFVPSNHQNSAGLVVSGQPVSSSVWLGVAANAWAYFQPGVGVDPNTGLPYASGTNFEAFTAWDLGVYIQAVLDAQKLGLVNTGGSWGSSARLEKVMSFLENRPLNACTGYPYWYYDATTGQDYRPLSDKETGVVDSADTGRLFVALNNLRIYNSSLTLTIDSIVYNQSDYAALLPTVAEDATSSNIYSYYIDSGFASFWPQQVGNVPNEVIDNIVSLQNVTTFGISLPDATITTEPMLCAIFELNGNNTELNGLMKQVYLAHEAYFDATGKYVAFSEGNSFTSQYLYEWVVAPNGQTWKITSTLPNLYLNLNPIIYTKVAFSFLALYNSTFAQNLVIYLQNMLPNPTANGYCDGANSNGQTVPGTGCNTNGLILDAALYATHNIS
jgi:hypothetical protein